MLRFSQPLDYCSTKDASAENTDSSSRIAWKWQINSSKVHKTVLFVQNSNSNISVLSSRMCASFSRSIVGRNGVICCTDDFFVVKGRYIFEPEKLSLYHQKNQEKGTVYCCASLHTSVYFCLFLYILQLVQQLPVEDLLSLLTTLTALPGR